MFADLLAGVSVYSSEFPAYFCWSVISIKEFISVTDTEKILMEKPNNTLSIKQTRYHSMDQWHSQIIWLFPLQHNKTWFKPTFRVNNCTLTYIPIDLKFILPTAAHVYKKFTVLRDKLM